MSSVPNSSARVRRSFPTLPSIFLSFLLVDCLRSQETAILSRGGGPYVDGKFRGRIGYSADGNHNDPDDWAASPVALAIFAECGLRDRAMRSPDVSEIHCSRHRPAWNRGVPAVGDFFGVEAEPVEPGVDGVAGEMLGDRAAGKTIIDKERLAGVGHATA